MRKLLVDLCGMRRPVREPANRSEQLRDVRRRLLVRRRVHCGPLRATLITSRAAHRGDFTIALDKARNRDTAKAVSYVPHRVPW